MMYSSKLAGLLFVPLLTVGMSCSSDGEGFDTEVDGTEWAASGGSLVQIGNNGSPSSAFPLGLCEGDCDNDNECASGLKCFQRSGTESVPGCDGAGTSGIDYCYEPADSNSLIKIGNNGSPASAFPLNVCEGDCDNDNECASGLKCFQRSGTESVPGCNGAGESGSDYCYEKAVNPCSDGSCNDGALERNKGTDVRIGVYNVYRTSIFPKAINQQSSGKRAEAFKRVAQAVHADIWAMQEVMYSENINWTSSDAKKLETHLESITGQSWNMAHHDDYKEFVFSRYPIVARGGKVGVEGRRTMWALINVGNDGNASNDVAIINVHMMKDGQGEETANLVKKILAGTHTIPKTTTLVVVGDFNNTDTGPRYNAVRSAIGIPDLRPIWIGGKHRTNGGGVKFNGQYFEEGSAGNPIDFIFPRTNSYYTVSKRYILNTLILDQTVLHKYGLQRLDSALDPNQSYSAGDTVGCDHPLLVFDLQHQTRLEHS